MDNEMNNEMNDEINDEINDEMNNKVVVHNYGNVPRGLLFDNGKLSIAELQNIQNTTSSGLFNLHVLTQILLYNNVEAARLIKTVPINITQDLSNLIANDIIECDIDAFKYICEYVFGSSQDAYLQIYCQIVEIYIRIDVNISQLYEPYIEYLLSKMTDRIMYDTYDLINPLVNKTENMQIILYLMSNLNAAHVCNIIFRFAMLRRNDDVKVLLINFLNRHPGRLNIYNIFSKHYKTLDDEHLYGDVLSRIVLCIFECGIYDDASRIAYIDQHITLNETAFLLDNHWLPQNGYVTLLKRKFDDFKRFITRVINKHGRKSYRLYDSNIVGIICSFIPFQDVIAHREYKYSYNIIKK